MADPTVYSGDLITGASWKTMMGITADDYNSILSAANGEGLIQSVSALVKNYCQRDFLAANFREWHDGRDEPDLYLRQYPIIDIRYISNSWTDAIRVRYTGTANLATVEVEDQTSLVLKSVAAGTQTATTLAFSTYTTLTLLVAAINATSGWEASLLTTDQDAQDPTRLLTYEGGNARNSWLTVQTEGEPLTDYRVEEDRGILTKDLGVWSKGRQNYVVFYSAGYGTVGNTATQLIGDQPADLKQIVKDAVSYSFRKRTRDTSLKSEKLDQYAYTVADLGASGLPKDVEVALAPWRRWTLI